MEGDQPAPKRPKLSDNMSVTEQASSSSSSSLYVGSKGIVKKSELVRLLIEALNGLGYGNIGKLLERESGIPLCSNEAVLFMQQIINGQWDESVATLINISHTDIAAIKYMCSLIYEQKFFEILEGGNFMEALKTLQTEIKPLCDHDKVRELAFYILRPSQNMLKPREELLEELKGLLPPNLMVPKNRLVDLVERNIEMQKRACMFHNPLIEEFSLFDDHQCGMEQIPSQTSQVLIEHNDEVWFLKFSHNGKYLASSSRDGLVIIWEDQGTGEFTLKHKLSHHQKPVSQISWSPNDLQILTCGLDESVLLWNVISGERIRTYSKGNYGTVTCGWHPDGESIFTGSYYGEVPTKNFGICLWNLQGDELNHWGGLIFTQHPHLEIRRNKRELIVCDKKRILVYRWELDGSKHIVENEIIVSVSSSADGKFLLVSLSNDKIHLYNTEGDHPALLVEYKGHKCSRFVVWSCFGGRHEAFIASGSEDSLVYIWNRDSGNLISTLEGHSGVVNCVSWNPINPHMLASASVDRTIRIWGT